MNDKIRFPAEWEHQEAVQITWPHSEEIWDSDYTSITELFVSISKIMISHVRLIIICLDPILISSHFSKEEKERIIFLKSQSNDIWSRDHGFITIYKNQKVTLLNFIFNGWGMKFPANFDNQINNNLKKSRIFNDDIKFSDIPFVFEGGSIDSNGNGEALTTSTCLFSKNRNEFTPKEKIIDTIKKYLGLTKLHILKSGYLKGDDTDSHIDMLARFVKEDTVVYATCNENDEHHTALSMMYLELTQLKDKHDKPFNLIGIPIGKVYYEDKRLPASYINFLIVNDTIFLPSYNIKEDGIAKEIFSNIFPNKQVLFIDCSLLIKQGGSLHCATMNFFSGTFK